MNPQISQDLPHVTSLINMSFFIISTNVIFGLPLDFLFLPLELTHSFSLVH